MDGKLFVYLFIYLVVFCRSILASYNIEGEPKY